MASRADTKRAAAEQRLAEQRRLLVGRDAERARLWQLWEQASRGTLRLAVVCGEPGIGKSRLLQAFGGEVGAEATCLVGHCDEEALIPYQPFVDALAGLDPRDAPLAGPHTAAMRVLLPGAAGGDLPDLQAENPQTVRLRLFAAVCDALVAAAAAGPLLLVLEDLQWADVSTVHLVRHLVRGCAGSPLLVVASLRATDLVRGHPLIDLVRELVRDGVAERIELGGLSAAEVMELGQGVVGISATPSVCRAVQVAAGGNPLFVEQLLRHLVDVGTLAADGRWAEGATLEEAGLPEALTDLIAHRLARLSESCRRVLGMAAVIGREFDLSLLEPLLAIDVDAILEALDEALAARVIVESRPDVGHYSFAHSLMREVLQGSMSRTRRIMLHARIADALEQQGGDRQLAQLAHHRLEAAPLGDAAPAVELARAAAERAMRQAAYEQAASLLRRALGVVESAGGGDIERTADILLALGAAQAAAGEVGGARLSFLDAAARARQAGMSERFALAVLGLAGPVGEAGIVDQELVTLLGEAGALLDEGAPAALRSRVLARLAMELYYVRAEEDRRAAIADHALRLARESGDRRAVGIALMARHYAFFRPTNSDERLAMATEMLDVARAVGDRELELHALHYQAVDLLGAGDLDAVRAIAAEHARLSAEVRQPAHVWISEVLETTVALAAAHFDDAERLSQRALATGQECRPVDALQYFGASIFNVGREQEWASEMEHTVRVLAAEYPAIPAWQCGYVWVLVESGRLVEARASLDQVLAGGLDSLPRDSHWMVSMGTLAEIAVGLDDAALARSLLERLEPHASRHVTAGFACVYFGPVVRVLGRLRALVGDHAAAVELLDEAIAITDRIGAVAYAAWSRRELAVELLRHGTRADHTRAAGLLGTALGVARSHGMSLLVRTVADDAAAAGIDVIEVEPVGAEAAAAIEPPPLTAATLWPRQPDADARPRAASLRPAPVFANVFRREGDVWSLSYAGRVMRLRDARGLGYLATLLARPGTEVHVLDLVAAARGVAARDAPPDAELLAAGLHVDGGDAGPVIDQQARQAYRVRLADLQAELDEAETNHDPVRAEAARDEIEVLTHELTRGLGLSGRPRSAASVTERARSSVTKAIHSAVERIESTSPELGFHLRSTVRTGTLCTYAPDPTRPADWQT